MIKMSQKSLVKLSLFGLVLSLLFLLGFTYAWFTFKVESTGNVITTGKLEVEMLYNDGSVNENNEVTWINAASVNEPMFNLSHVEPGFRAARYLKISNTGNLGFKYQLNITSNYDYSTLGQAFDVYIIPNTIKPLERFNAEMNRDYLIGSLDQVINENITLSEAVMYPESDGSINSTKNQTDLATFSEPVYITLLIKMKDDAGIEFMDKTFEGSFNVQVSASQYSFENDDIDNSYDDNAI